MPAGQDRATKQTCPGAGFQILLLLILAMLLPSQAGAWNWIHAGIDSSSGQPGQFINMKRDRVGRFHGSYYRFDSNSEGNRNLKYTTNASLNGSGPWQTVVVDGTASSGSYSSIALTRENVPHISYYESEFANLRHAWYDSTAGAWMKETVDSPGTVGQYSAMAVDTTSNTLYIAYFDASAPGLKVARKAPGSLWAFEFADQSGTVGLYNSIAVNGNVQIAYYDLTKRDLKFAERIGGQWFTTTVDSIGDVGRHTSIGGTFERVWIAYYDVTNRKLKFAERVNDQWAVQTIDGAGDPGSGTALSTGPAERPCIAYYAAATQDLRYAERFHGTWVYSTIATGGNVGRYCGVATGLNDLPNVLYYDETQGKLRFAHGTGGTTAVPEPPAPTAPPAVILRVRHNPARAPVTLDMDIASGGRLTLRVFDVTGRSVRDLLDGIVTSGPMTVQWDGADDAGRPLPAGIYFGVARSAAGQSTSRIALVH